MLYVPSASNRFTVSLKYAAKGFANSFLLSAKSTVVFKKSNFIDFYMKEGKIYRQ